MIGISTLEYANLLIHAVLIKEQKRLIKLLRERVGPEVKVQAGFGSNSHSNIYLENDKLSMNDYRNYLWICIKNGEDRHWLTLFYNDVDEKSGNFHTQFGRIQFWKHVEQNNHLRNGINKKCQMNPTCWVLDEQNMKDPHMWIDSPKYDAKDIANDFLRYVKIKNKLEVIGGEEKNESTKENNNDSNCIDFSNCVNCCMGNKGE